MNDTLVLHACFEADPQPPTLESYSWEEISLIAGKGEGREHFSIGDEKKVSLRTGEEIVVQIYGFDHDEREDGGKAGITFGMKDVLKNTQKMGGQPNRDYFGGYRESEMQKHLDSRVFLNLPTDLAKAIVPVRKFTSSGYPDHQIEETTEGLFLFSCAEIGFFDLYEGALAGEGEIYEFFERATSLPIKYDQDGKGTFWWLRSFNKYSNYMFLGVEEYGYPSDGPCYQEGGIAFGFALGEEISYAVNYDSLGGTAIDDAVVVHNGLITEPADPTRADHAFEGWYRDPEFTQAYDFSQPLGSDLTLYAKWRATTALVSFELFGGTDIAPIKVDRGAGLEKPADPTKVDAIFNQWYTDAELENRYNFNSLIDEDLTLYAKWINKGATLDSYSWQDIGIISQAGRGSEFFNLGDIKNITLNETAHPFEIVGFDHDDQVAGGKAGITFGSQTVVDPIYCRPFNRRKTNKGGWDASSIRVYLNNEMIDTLPAELQSQLLEVVKLTSNGSPTHQLIKSYDKLFLFSDTETCNVATPSTLDGEGSLYPLFKGGEANLKRAKFLNGHPDLVASYSLRSDVVDNDHDFYSVASHGSMMKQAANKASGLVFGFCI